MNIKQFFRKVVLNILLVFSKIGAIFHWEYAESAVEDISLALNDNFINAMRKMIAYIDKHPESFDDMINELRTYKKKYSLYVDTNVKEEK